MANNFNQVGLMPGTAIRVPVNVYPGFQNGQRVITRPAHFTMQPNGVHINGAYMPGIPFPNNQINVIRRIPNQPNLLKIQKEAFFMRLLSFAEQLGDNIIHWKEVHWRELTNRFFADDTSMKYTLWAPISQKKFFEIKYQVIPRFYQTFIESGVIKIQLILGNPRPSQYNQVVCPSASIVYHYRNGIQVVAPGQLTVTFNGNLKMMEFDFQTTKYTEFLPKQQCHEFIQIPSPLNEYGIPHKTMRCLEVGEGVDYMHDVMMHTINNRNIGPIHALSIIASQSQNPNNINVAAQAVANSVTTTPNIQNSPLVKKEMKSDAQNYNSIPPTINSNDLRTAPTTPLTPKQTPQQTPTLAPSALVSNANDIGSPRQKKSSTQSPAISGK
ncbi:3661_t:CDS:2 [Cetraspora pellucida]|uniref:3661_t:CDS:1 n=1 Tax=Cetraspora pellucida TaxID=1433469 RepID=A0A9N9IAF7_9GLOM|nr:3661_t:CDS:2 [Cetraspora pellucida]